MKVNHNWLIAAGCCLLLAACGDPQQDWEEARLADTQQAYADFLERYPEGSYAQRAQTRIAELEREQAWEDARTAATASAYAAFLNQYPAGMHSREARQRVEEIEREAAWNRLRAPDGATLDGLRAFVAAYPGSVEADQARSMIATLDAGAAAASDGPTAGPASRSADSSPGTVAATAAPGVGKPAQALAAGDFRVQLGAFGDRNNAEQERERLQQAYGDVLGSVVVETAGTEPVLFRVRSAPMAREPAREACAALAKDDQACIVVAR